MKRLLFIILISLCSLGASSQNMDALFELMPDQYIPQLENAWRKDLVDLFNAGKEAKLKNTMNGFSSLKALTNNYLLLQVTESSTVEMKLLPLINNTNVICMVTTVNGPVPDSQIRFFSPEWKLLNPTDLITLVDADWFLKENIDKNDLSYLEASSHVNMYLRKMTLSPDNLTLTVEYTTPQYLDKDTRKKLELFLKSEPKVYVWNKSHFE